MTPLSERLRNTWNGTIHKLQFRVYFPVQRLHLRRRSIISACCSFPLLMTTVAIGKKNYLLLVVPCWAVEKQPLHGEARKEKRTVVLTWQHRLEERQCSIGTKQTLYHRDNSKRCYERNQATVVLWSVIKRLRYSFHKSNRDLFSFLRT